MTHSRDTGRYHIPIWHTAEIKGDIIYQYDTQAVNESQPVDQLVPIQEKPMRGYSCPQNMEQGSQQMPSPTQKM